MHKRDLSFHRRPAAALVGALVLASFCTTTADAGNIFGVDAADYLVMYEGAAGKNLTINNFGTTPRDQVWAGDIGISGTGKIGARGTVRSVSSNNGQNFTIQGDGSTGVVLDVNTPGDAQFHGNILLQDLSGKFFGNAGYAGLFPDQVLSNLYEGIHLAAGDKVDANNGNDANPANIIYGAFLNPNGAMSFANTRTVGVFGGGSLNNTTRWLTGP